MGSKENLISYLKKTQAMVVVLSIFALMAIPLATYLIPLIFGVGYVSSGPVFIILLFASLVYLVSVPIHMSVFYYFSYPRLFLYVSVVHLLIISGMGYVLISKFGIMGAAFTVLTGAVSNFVIPLAWVFQKLKYAENK